jgi:spore germination protein YaaH
MALDRFARGLAGGLSAALRWTDSTLRTLDRSAAAGRDLALRAAGLRVGDLTAPGLVSRLPESLRRAVGAVGQIPSDLGHRLGRTFRFVPEDRNWRQAATGLVLLLAVVTFSSLFLPPEARPLPPGVWRPVVVGYYENGWSATYPDSLPTLQRYAERIDIVMPFWYSIRPDGVIEDRGAKREVVDLAHANGLAVVPLMNNAKSGASAGFLPDPAARRAVAAEIKTLVEENDYDGVHIDFELLPPSWREELTSFIAEIRTALDPGRHVSMAVFPPVDVDYELSGVFDYASLSNLCDFLVIMVYDHHYAGGPAGPISPYEWVERNIAHTLALGVPAGKVVIAVGGYGYDWPTGDMATDIPSRLAADFARRRGATLLWDTASQNPYFTYYEGRNRHEVWYQDERIMAQRLEQARRYGLRGLAIWRLGYETPETWTVLAGELGVKRGPAGR